MTIWYQLNAKSVTMDADAERHATVTDCVCARERTNIGT